MNLHIVTGVSKNLVQNVNRVFYLAVTREYLGTLDYRLGGAELEGLSTFFRRLTQDGLAPGGALSFISAA